MIRMHPSVRDVFGFSLDVVVTGFVTFYQYHNSGWDTNIFSEV